MATDKQVSYIKSLYNQLGQEPEGNLENLDNSEVQKVIAQLKDLINENKKFEPHEDKCYWY